MNLFVLLTLLCISSAASATQELLPPALDQLRQDGFSSLYNMHYQEAEKNFKEMIRTEPKHPAGYVYLASTIWLEHLAALRRLQTSLYNRNDSFFFESNEETDRKVENSFRETMEKGIRLAETMLQANEKDPVALYYLGVGRNISAGFDTTVKRKFLPALRNASKGVDLHRKLTKENPAMIDPQLSVGMYNYVVGSLPFAIKILAFLGGVRGSKTEGLKMVENVAKNGNYSKYDASAMLILLYSREKRFGDSLKVVQKLSAAFPDNPLFKLEEANTLALLKRFKESYAAFDTALKHPAAMSYMPDLVHYKYAEASSDGGAWEQALEQYLRAAEKPRAPASLVTLAHLRAGQCLDVLGKRQEALQKYQIVLNRTETLDSRELAKKYSKRPFTAAEIRP